MVAIAASASKTVYLAPGTWDVENTTEYFALWAWPEGGEGQWAVREEVGLGVYKFTFDDTCQKMFFLRTSADEDYWNNEWARTSEITVPSTDDVLYTITSNDNNTYTESSYSFYTSIRALSEGKYYLKNVASGKFWGAGNSWGTQATLVEHPEYVTLHPYISDGHYTLESQVENNGGHFFEGDYMDNGNAYWLRVAKKANNKYTFSKSDGTDNTYFGYDGSTTVLGKGLAADNENALWEVISESEMKATLNDATVANPVDATFLILDPNFGRNNRNVTAWTMAASNQNLSGGNNTNNCAESYHSTFTLSQAINNVPNGIYDMTAQGFYRQDGSDNEHLPYFYINSRKQPFFERLGEEGSMSAASESFTNGLYTIEPIRVVVTNGTITLGAKNEKNTGLWCVFDNFTLKYSGVDLTAYGDIITSLRGELNDLFNSPMDATIKSDAQTVYSETATVEETAAAMETAISRLYEAIDNVNTSIIITALRNKITELREELNNLFSSPMNVTIKSNAQTVYSETATVEETVAAMETAIGDLYNAINAVNATIANYAVIKSEILEAANIYDSYGQAAYAAEAAIAAIQAAYDEGSLDAITDEHRAARNAALPVACRAQKQPLDGCDMTPWIVNPGIDGNVDGWTCDKNGNGGYAGGPLKPSNDAMEFWGAGTLTDTDKGKGFDYHQTITNLPDGVYTISADMFNSTNGEEGAEWNGGGKAGLYGKTTISEIRALVTTDGETFQPYTTEEICVIDGELRIGVKNIESLTGRWFVADNFKLTYVRQLTDEDKAAVAKVGYDEALANAKTVAATTETVSAHWLGELNSTIDKYENKVDETSEAALLAAIDELNAAIAIVEKSIASYAIIASGTVRTDVLDGWSCTNSQTFHINTWSVEGNPGNDPSGMTTPFIENWIAKGSVLGEGTFSYTLEYLEPGEVYYAQALIRSYNEKDATAPNGPDFFVNGTSAKLSEVGTTFTYNGMSGIYATLGAAAEVGADGKITIGARIAADANYNWVAFKNVSIQTMDVALAAAVKMVTDLEGTVPTGIYNAAYAVVRANTGDNKPTTAKGYEDAIAAIEAAAETAKLAYAPVAENAKILEKANTTAALELLAAEDKATLQDVIDNNTDDLNACEDVADIEAQNEALWTAIFTAINSVVLTGDQKLDLTYLLTNPDLSSGFTDTQKNVDGWYTEQTGGNSQVKHIYGESVREGYESDWIYEYWSASPKANGKFALYQKVNLPEGTYTIDCYAFSNQSVDGETPIEPGVHGVYFYANDTQGSCVTTTRLTEQEVSFVNDVEQEVKIGLKTVAGNTYRWMGIGYMHLYKVSAMTYAVNENEDWTSTDGAGDVTLTRTIKEGVNTLVLPFSMTQAEVEDNFGEGSKVYVVSKFENDNISFTTHDGISANMPCLLKATKATEAGTSYLLEGRTIVAGEPVINATDGSVSMIGSYAASITVPTEGYNYIISNKEGEPKIYPSSG
jgi:hypothetical protein